MPTSRRLSAIDRDSILHKLQQRGYTRLTGLALYDRCRPWGCEELLSPEGDAGDPIVPCPHSILINSSSVKVLYDGATLSYAVPLPERTIRLLLRGVL